jgi:hypothetical protein
MSISGVIIVARYLIEFHNGNILEEEEEKEKSEDVIVC